MSQQNSNIHIQNPTLRNRISGIIILIVVFTILWIYGWVGEISLVSAITQPSNYTSQTIYGKLLVFSAIFTVIGFGLLLSLYKYSPATGFFTSIFIVSFTMLISPIIQKFWFNVLISNFQGKSYNGDITPDRFYYFTFGKTDILIDFYNFKVPLVNSISQLIAFLMIFGKLSHIQIVPSTIVFNLCWNLNHFICVLLQINSPDNRIFDDYQISNVYLYGATYAIIVNLMIVKPRLTQRMIANQETLIFSMIGTFFNFLSFCTTTTFFSLKFTPAQLQFPRSYIWQQAFISTFFALSGSVIGTYAIGILLGNWKISMKQTLIGTINGSIMYGSVAGTCVNIGTALTVGLGAGVLSAIYFTKISPKINAERLNDSFGGLIIVITSFIGTFLIAPIVLKAYYDYQWHLTTLEVSNFDSVGPIFDSISVVGWILVYVGSVSGLIIGLLFKIIGGQLQEFGDNILFDQEFGLKPKFERVETLENQDTSQGIVKNVKHGLQK